MTIVLIVLALLLISHGVMWLWGWFVGDGNGYDRAQAEKAEQRGDLEWLNAYRARHG